MTRKVLVVGGNTAISLELSRLFVKSGYNVYLANKKGQNNFVSYLKGIRGTYLYEFINDLIESLLKKPQIFDVILPITEEEILACCKVRDELEFRGSIVPVPQPSSLITAMDKEKTIKLSRELGIPAPRTFALKSIGEVKKVAKELEYPAIIKIRRQAGIESPRHIIAHDPSDLSRKYAYLSHKQEKPLIQEYINGYGAGAFFIFNKYSKVVSCFTHKRLIEHPITGGVSVAAQSTWNKKIIALGYKILHRLKWRGPAMVEFRISKNGTPYIMEINPRFWGSMPLAYFSGLNLPNLLIKHYEDKNPIIKTNYILNTEMVFLHKLPLTILQSIIMRKIGNLKYVMNILLNGARPKIAELTAPTPYLIAGLSSFRDLLHRTISKPL